jgi:hypothetical protein
VSPRTSPLRRPRTRTKAAYSVSPSLLMVSRDLIKVLNDQYPKEPETQAYHDQLHARNSLHA